MPHPLLTRACALPAAAGLVALTSAPAAAHVGIGPSEAEAGSYAVLTVSVPHGCEGSPTTRVAVSMPEQVTAVTPTRNALWEVEKAMEELDEPITDSHGAQVTERVDQVVYTTDTPLPEGYRDAFELSLRIPDVAGETLVFPVVQTCREGEAAWVETAADGSTEELEYPAPTVTVLPAGDEAADASADGGTETGTSSAVAASTEAAGASSEGGTSTLGILGLVAGLLGLVAGATALVLVRRRA